MSTEETIIGATAMVHFNDEPERVTEWYFSFGDLRYDDNGDVIGDSFGVVDEDVDFYCSYEEFQDIADNVGGEDFTIHSFTYEKSW